MVTSNVISLSSEPTAHPGRRTCGHTHHVGTCAACQRAARSRSEAQLLAAEAARQAWAAQRAA